MELCERISEERWINVVFFFSGEKRVVGGLEDVETEW